MGPRRPSVRSRRSFNGRLSPSSPCSGRLARIGHPPPKRVIWGSNPHPSVLSPVRPLDGCLIQDDLRELVGNSFRAAAFGSKRRDRSEERRVGKSVDLGGRRNSNKKY